ncbi:hypothetical protein F5X71_34665 [Nocardia brasiliensis]|uniref:Phage terminase, small subunit n=1 Tax=Nocardia brasiliensis TaxID=37326 RepID=A0A6G9Y0X6_NOCBR|nr:P27 family phage terminase small subunit [Nocardia brasiliensis]QIS06770.1 hypothetical protein F5X71_34665 [Nocardia brasiliensis]
MKINPPFALTKHAKEHWHRHADRIYDEGRADVVNLDALAMYADCMALYQEAMARMRADGMIRPGERGGLSRHPGVMVLNSLRVDMMRLAKLVPLYDNKIDPTDGLDAFLKDAEGWANDSTASGL